MGTKDHRTALSVTPGSGPSDDPDGPGAGDSQPVDTAAAVSRPSGSGGPPRRWSPLGRAPGGRGRRRFAYVLALLVVAAVVVGVLLATRASSRKPTGGVPVVGTATVERRDLVQTDTESGTIGYANPQTVYGRLSGTVTRLPRVGELIKPGQPLYDVDGQPVILMNGTTPAYRELTSGDSDGQDILQLNRSLVKLGFNPERIRIDDVWQPATTAGVETFQASLGEARSGSLGLGQVVFLPGDRIVSAVQAGLGSTGGGGASDPSSTGSPVSASGAGGGGGSAAPVLQTTSARLIVTVDLDTSRQSEATVGEPVTVQMPNGDTVGGVTTGVSAVAASSSNSSEASSSVPGSSSSVQATIPVTIRLKGRVSGARLDQAPVSVNFAQAVAKNVLSVPVTALVATPGGNYALQSAQAPHQLIPVTTSLFAAGYVQISGPRIHDGLRVTNSQG